MNSFARAILFGALLMPASTAFGDLVVAWSSKVYLFDEETGALVGQGLQTPYNSSITQITIGPDGHIYASLNHMGPGLVARFDSANASVIDQFVPYDGYNTDRNTLLRQPFTLEFGPDRDLFVACALPNGSGIFRYNGGTGQLKGQFLPGSSTFRKVFTFGPDGKVYILNESTNGWTVSRLRADTAEFIDDFAALPTETAPWTMQMVFAKNGDLFLLRPNVYRIDGRTGEFKGVFIDTAAAGFKGIPFRMAIGPDGDFYIAEAETRITIWRFDGVTGASKGIFLTGPRPDYGTEMIMGLAFTGPRLSVTHSAGGISMRWPPSHTGYRLETRDAFDQPWQEFLGEPSPDRPQKFFRLIKR